MRCKFHSPIFILMTILSRACCLSTVPAPTSISQKIAFSDHVGLSSDKILHVLKPIPAGTTLVEWHQGACLTAEAAYSDMDVGLKLRELAPRVGPGFELVAIATLLGAEYIRNFQTRPCAFMPEGGDDRYFTEISSSQWSEVTQDIWADAANINAEAIDPGLEPIINQGVRMAMPILDATMRRAWSSGHKGRSADELSRVMKGAFHLMLRHRHFPPSDNGRWGWHNSAPEGPALLPFISNILVQSESIGIHGQPADNAILRCPSIPEDGFQDKGVCLQCVAGRDLVVGEKIHVELN